MVNIKEIISAVENAVEHATKYLGPAARYWPLLVAIFLIICSILLLYNKIGTQRKESLEPVEGTQEQLQKVLTEKARVITSEISQLPFKMNISRFRLVSDIISGNSDRIFKNPDEEGHYNCKYDTKDIWIPSEKLELANMFQTVDDMISELANNKANKHEYDDFMEEHGNIVALIGQAGIGKTAIALKFVEGIVNEEVLPHTEYIFYISCQSIDLLSEMNVLEFLLSSTGCVWNHSDASDRELIDTLQESPNVVLIFDGLECTNVEALSEMATPCDIFEPARPIDLIKNILHGKIFPKAKKLVTTYPRLLFDMHTQFRPLYAAEVLGISKESFDEICLSICEENCKIVQQYLNTHPDVKFSCHVPLKCIITLLILSKAVKKNKNSIEIDSLTEIFTEALKQFLGFNFGGVGSEVCDICSIAWHMYLFKKIIFFNYDFQSAKIEPDKLKNFFFTIPDMYVKISLFTQGFNFHFCHLTWRDFLSALHLMLIMPEKEFSQIRDDLVQRSSVLNNEWETVLKFMYGFCNPRVLPKIGKFAWYSTSLFKSKLILLQEMIAKYMQKVVASPSEGRLMLHVCSWIHEANNEEFTKIVLQNLPSELLLVGDLYPIDIANLEYLALKLTDPMYIRFAGSFTFHDDSFQRSLKLYTCSMIHVVNLNISDKDITVEDAEMIVPLLDKVEELHLKRSNFSFDVAEIMCSKIASLDEPMQTLNLSNNVLDDQCLIQISHCLCNVKRMFLSHCNISDDGVRILANGLISLKTPIMLLDLSHNKIGDDPMEELSENIHKIKKLYLNHCKLTSDAVKHLRNGFRKSDNQQMLCLNLSGNEIGNAGMQVLLDCINKIDDLELSSCHITAEGFKGAGKKLKHFEHMTKKMNLEGNEIGDKGATALAECIHSFFELNVKNCGISELGIKSLEHALKPIHNPKPTVFGLMKQDQKTAAPPRLSKK